MWRNRAIVILDDAKEDRDECVRHCFKYRAHHVTAFASMTQI